MWLHFVFNCTRERLTYVLRPIIGAIINSLVFVATLDQLSIIILVDKIELLHAQIMPFSLLSTTQVTCRCIFRITVGVSCIKLLRHSTAMLADS